MPLLSVPETAIAWEQMKPPPAILSIFLGRHLSHMLDEVVARLNDAELTPDEKKALQLGIGRIPAILQDNTDRNRTSPFAFTGNRFEFRAAGSSANCAASMIVINAAMAHQLNEFKTQIDKISKREGWNRKKLCIRY